MSQHGNGAQEFWDQLRIQHDKVVSSDCADVWRIAVLDAQTIFVAALSLRPDLPIGFAYRTDSEKIHCFRDLAENEHIATAIRIRNKLATHRGSNEIAKDPRGEQAISQVEALCAIEAYESALGTFYGFSRPRTPTKAEETLIRQVQELRIAELSRSKEQAEEKLQIANNVIRVMKTAAESTARLDASAEQATKRWGLRRYAREKGIKLEQVLRVVPFRSVEQLSLSDIDQAGLIIGDKTERQKGGRTELFRRTDLDRTISLWAWVRGGEGKLDPHLSRTILVGVGAIAIIVGAIIVIGGLWGK